MNIIKMLTVVQLRLNEIEHDIMNGSIGGTHYAIRSFCTSNNIPLYSVKIIHKGVMMEMSEGDVEVNITYTTGGNTIAFFKLGKSETLEDSFPEEMEKQYKRIIKQYMLYMHDALELHKV